MKKIFKRMVIIISSIFILLIGTLWIYTLDGSSPSNDMYDAIDMLDTSDLTIEEKFDHITYKVDDPIKNIVIIPGGKVDPESYSYLAIRLALEAYDVTIVKTLFDLAILTPNYGSRFLSDEIDNVVIGHSLGGTVASMFAFDDERVTDMIFLASYPIKDVSNKRVLAINAENDLVLDETSYEEALSLMGNSTQALVQGGNHAGFGWYGEQKGDGEASITTKEQQDVVIDMIIIFLNQ